MPIQGSDGCEETRSTTTRLPDNDYLFRELAASSAPETFGPESGPNFLSLSVICDGPQGLRVRIGEKDWCRIDKGEDLTLDPFEWSTLEYKTNGTGTSYFRLSGTRRI